MSQSGGQPESNRTQQVFSLPIAMVALQVGCLTLFIIIGALVAGYWLDRTLDTLPIFLIIFLVGSMPLSWVAIFFVVNRAKKHFINNHAGQVNRLGYKEEFDVDRD
jgi:F0F1-type ATP synthase assembly protein I